MISVNLLKPDGTRTTFGPKVETLEEARIIVKVLDHLCLYDDLPKGADFYTGETEVQAWDLESGEVLNYWDQDPSGNSDGIWM